MSPAFSPRRVEYIALHKKVKPYFAVQYGLTKPPRRRLTLSQSASSSLTGCAAGRLSGQRKAGRCKKGPEKLQKTALFGSSNRFTSARQGCRRSARGV